MTIPTDGMIIHQDTVLDPGVYFLPNGISIEADDVTLDGSGATLIGLNRAGIGLKLQGRVNVRVKNLKMRDYYHAIHASQCRQLTISQCQATSSAEVPANTIFLDIWLTAAQAYGGGILLADCTDTLVLENDLQHNMCGLLSYGCNRLTVRGNNASYCSGYGFHVFETSDSIYEDNCADYCCRWEPRGERRGHMGADATGFLIIHSSCRNLFRRNLARLGGDGFFLAGLSPSMLPVPCNDNRFEENDGSYSPNIAFEATFSSGNVWVNNLANFCNYGFWLGFSSNGIVENNQMIGCRQAGIGTEMGFNFQVRGNLFRENEHGVLLWSKHIPVFLGPYPENNNSYNWVIEDNTFIHNAKGVRIAANQDHGIRPYRVPDGQDPTQFCRPYNHRIQNNTFQDNRTAVEALYTDQTAQDGNRFEGNVEHDCFFLS